MPVPKRAGRSRAGLRISERASAEPGQLCAPRENTAWVRAFFLSKSTCSVDDEIRGDVRGSRDELCCHARVNSAAHGHLLD
jgi:hypothetical protein